MNFYEGLKDVGKVASFVVKHPLESTIILSTLLGVGCGEKLPEPRGRGLGLDKVLYDTLYSGRIDSLFVNFEEVTKIFFNGDTAAHYHQMEVVLSDGEKIYMGYGGLDKDVSIDYVSGDLSWEEGNRIYKFITGKIKESINQ